MFLLYLLLMLGGQQHRLANVLNAENSFGISVVRKTNSNRTNEARETQKNNVRADTVLNLRSTHYFKCPVWHDFSSLPA